MSIIRDLYHLCENILSPPYCAHCLCFLDKRIPLCASCYALINPIVTLDLPLTPSVTIPVRAMGTYEDPLKHLLVAKQQGVIVAAQQLGFLLAEHLKQTAFEADVLVPVPLHWRRIAWRGYNQAEVIAQELGKQFSIPVLPLARRIRHTPQQFSRAAHERGDNVATALVWNDHYDPALFYNKRIVIVDDLMTTGSTLRATGRALLKIKDVQIQAIVVARVP